MESNPKRKRDASLSTMSHVLYIEISLKTWIFQMVSIRIDINKRYVQF